MIAFPKQLDPMPADPLGQRLCELFGRYRWSFIQADLPNSSSEKPEWKTERRYPIKSRVLWSQWQNAAQLIGVRFDDTTLYAVIDIDINSQYHPRQNKDSLNLIEAALETIGIARIVHIRSSWNGGLHLYIPLSEAVSTFNLAVALKQCLEVQGFEISPGQLEIFPNDKAYGVTQKIEYRAHRLPLQPGSGSHLLNEDLSPFSNQLINFFKAWDISALGQDLTALKSAMVIARENRRKRVKRRKLNNVEAWREDLESTLAEGWTSHGQTNHLLKEMGCYGVVFKQLSGEALVEYIYEQAIASPGYKQWCRHQHQIKLRARVWARSVESYYWPLGSHPIRSSNNAANDIVPFNQKVAIEAQQRIKDAVAQLSADQQLPEQTTRRANAIAKLARMSLKTLYKNEPLWHPHAEKQELPSELGVTQVIPVVMDIKPSSQSTIVKSPQPLPVKKLHPTPGIMKCRPRKNATSLQKKIKKSLSERDQKANLSLPIQKPSQPALCIEKAAPSERLIHNPNQITRNSQMLLQLDSVIREIQVQIRRLNWTFEQATQFISAHFGGRRRSQLNDDELTPLLHYLQNVKAPDI